MCPPLPPCPSADPRPDSFSPLPPQNETETRIGLSYDKLCQTLKPGNRILLSDGTISIEVVKILSPTELLGKVSGGPHVLYIYQTSIVDLEG